MTPMKDAVKTAASYFVSLHDRTSVDARRTVRRSHSLFMLQQYVFVAIGGTIGVLARYALQGALYSVAPRGFPYATIVINVIGCFIVGVVIAAADERGLISPQWRVLLTTGFCGGFTTFSTFSFETIALFRDGEIMYGVLYSGGSLLLGLGATVAGMFFGRMI